MLQIERVTKSYTAGQPVLRDLSLAVGEGEVVCLLGPSGCGKSTLLRIIAGLEEADRGVLTLNGQDLTTIAVHKRHFGLMFQDFALFPHRTVAENVAFGLRMAGMGRQAIAARVAEVLELVSLQGYGERSIFALSGGERQRVALARSLAPSPRLLMLDEPLGSLDRTLRDELVAELRTILKRLQVTAIYVTHDQQEAFAIADRLVVMRKGAIEQVDVPTAVYQQPANGFVARFLGFQNLLPTTGQTMASSLLLIRPDAVVTIQLAKESVLQEIAPVLQRLPFVTGRVQELVFHGSTYRMLIEVENGDLTTWASAVATSFGQQCLVFDVPTIQLAAQSTALTTGAQVTIWLAPSALCLIHS